MPIALCSSTREMDADARSRPSHCKITRHDRRASSRRHSFWRAGKTPEGDPRGAQGQCAPGLRWVISECARAVAAKYPDIAYDEKIVDVPGQLLAFATQANSMSS